MILANKLRHCGQAKEPAGDVTIFYNSVSGSNPEKVTGGNGSFTFTVPMGYTEVTICMIGGGGSGASSDVIGGNVSYGGGFAGTIISQVVSGLVGGQQVTVTIGAGGVGKTTSSTQTSSGNAGASSSFNGIVANGGAGGNAAAASYGGNGGSGSNCYATTTDGTRAIYTYLSYTNYAYGGQRGFGNGGNGRLLSTSGSAYSGTDGAGGGAAMSSSSYTRTSGAGGSGVCKISWA